MSQTQTNVKFEDEFTKLTLSSRHYLLYESNEEIIMKSKQKGSREPIAKQITKSGPGIRPCAICKKSRINPKDKNELDCAGYFYQLDKELFFHYFCLLFR